MSKLVSMASVALAVAASLAFAPPAAAGPTTVAVSMTLTHPMVAESKRGCPLLPSQGLCGSGEVIPFGHATDTVVYNGCGAGCDSVTIDLAAGSIYDHEIFSDPTCPGNACGRPGRGEPSGGTLTDTIVGGTGIFTGASGNLSGAVIIGAGFVGVAQLSGTITLQT